MSITAYLIGSLVVSVISTVIATFFFYEELKKSKK